MTGLISKCTMTLILLAGLTACSGLAVFNENAALEKRFQQRALDLEKQGELNQALLNWRVAAAMNPDNALTSKIITDLADTIEKQSSDQFANGVALFNKGKFDQARLSFIGTLHLKPNHKEALHYIKGVLPLVGYQQYTVQKGDSFTRIAADVYHDADKGYLLAYYNGFDPDKPLLTGTRLILPKFPGPYNQPRHDEKSQAETTASPDQGPVKAQTDEKDTTDTKKASVPRPSDEDQYQVGLALIEKGRYADARVQLEKISPEFDGRQEAIAKINGLMQKRTIDAELKQARNQLAQKSFQKAYDILENVLARSPDRNDARILMDEARYGWAKELMVQNQEDKAIAMLQTLGPSYKDANDLIAQARGKRNARADKLYRSGVRYYLNEELEQAVEAWKKALALNPEHPKAAADIANAIKLLEKWRDINPKERHLSEPSQ